MGPWLHTGNVASRRSGKKVWDLGHSPHGLGLWSLSLGNWCWWQRGCLTDHQYRLWWKLGVQRLLCLEERLSLTYYTPHRFFPSDDNHQECLCHQIKSGLLAHHSKGEHTPKSHGHLRREEGGPGKIEISDFMSTWSGGCNWVLSNLWGRRKKQSWGGHRQAPH